MTARVRIVVVNFGGGDLTLDCLHQLVRTDWPSDGLEIVLVDNASGDGAVARVRAELPAVRVIPSPVNLGFAGGCNLALHDLAGVDHVALVNNDVATGPGWLAPLVDRLEDDPSLGAACPKILLSRPCLDVEVRAEPHRRGRGDRRELGVRLSGVRVGGRDCSRLARPHVGFWGPEHGNGSEPEFQWTRATAVVRVPAPPDGAPPVCELRLASDRPTCARLASGNRMREHAVGTEPGWYEVDLGGEPFDVLNNAGSLIGAEGYGADRGYLERDHGQFDAEEDVPAWCGAAVLLRARYLEEVGLLDERLFLYYEDLELSLRGAEHGWRYRYVPESVVRHVHTATSVEGSALSHYYNERNRLLVLTRHAPLPEVARSLWRYALVTASYARRDVVSPWLRGERARWESVRRRLRALAGYVRLAPVMLASRTG